MKKLTKFWLPAVIWAVIIFLFSNFPTARVAPVSWQDFLFKKTIHLTEYAIFFTLWFRALKNTANFSLPKTARWVFIWTVLYAVTDEFHQTFIDGREGTVRDVIIDGVGALLAWLLIWRYLPKAPGRLKSWAKSWQLI